MRVPLLLTPTRGRTAFYELASFVFVHTQLHLYALQNVALALLTKHLDFLEYVGQVLSSLVSAFFPVMLLELNFFFYTNYSRTRYLPHIFLMLRLLSLLLLQTLLPVFANLHCRSSNSINLSAIFYYISYVSYLE